MNPNHKAKTLTALLAGLFVITTGGGLVTGAAAGAAVGALAVRAQSPAPVSRIITVSGPAAAPTAAATAAATSAAPADALQAAVESVYAQANPSVVYIVVSSGGNGYGAQASGSGFIYDKNGMIVTNAHVVEGAQSIEVVFADGSHQSANLVGADAANDLAVVQVASLPAGTAPLTLAADNSVQVGEFVAAIGSPFGEQNSLSFGVVSGLNRSMTSSGPSRFGRSSSLGSALTSLIQTDAPINPGNSGGPLLNLNGQVVGVDNAIESSSGSNAGVGFAIPVSVVRQVVPGIIASAG